MRNEVPTIESSHRVTNEVHPLSDRLVLEEIMERFGSRCDGTCAGDHSWYRRL